MKMNRIGLSVIVICVAIVAGCTNPDGPAVPQDLAGLWAGTFESTLGSVSLVATIGQAGASVTGSWSTSYPSSGRLAGTVDGSTIKDLVLTQTYQTAATFRGSALINNDGSNVAGSLTSDSGKEYTFSLARSVAKPE
ncbi:hypothetical protein [Salinispira pacifica]